MNQSSHHRGRTLNAIVAIAAVAAIAVIPIQTANASPRAKGVTPGSKNLTIVLEHGAWADGSSWSAVAARLLDDGYKVLVPPNPLRGLASDSAELANFVKYSTTGPVLLVGHSYGGAVITDAGLSDPDIKGLVYVDAFAPAEGQTLGGILAASTSDLNVPDPTTIFNIVPFVDPLAQNADVYLKPSTVKNVFAQDLSSLQQALIAAEQRPIAFGTFGEKAAAPAYASLPSWYVVGTQDRAIPEATQVAMATAAHSKITYVNSSHVSLISHPGVVTSVIEKAAESVG
ncbi:alpha/beta fold hydrolase [Lacisediminihabitans sp.]|uniref:alpha/beta fold hydrolase n=1 Tax=Lacisediminihabitans sp. TaxID=2787631 RepID=UPI00374DC993